MEDPQIGDYLITSKFVYEIIKKYEDFSGNIVYDIETLENPADFIDNSFKSFKETRRGISLKSLINVGTIIKKGDSQKILEILFNEG